MSSSFSRAPLPGVIRQNKKIIGSISLPEKDVQAFVNEFNHCYGPMSLHVECPAILQMATDAPLFPVGARRPTQLSMYRPRPTPDSLPGQDF